MFVTVGVVIKLTPIGLMQHRLALSCNITWTQVSSELQYRIMEFTLYASAPTARSSRWATATQVNYELKHSITVAFILRYLLSDGLNWSFVVFFFLDFILVFKAIALHDVCKHCETDYSQSEYCEKNCKTLMSP